MVQFILRVTSGSNQREPWASPLSGSFQTNEERELNGSAGNNHADHYSELPETQLVKRGKEGCLALVTQVASFCAAL